MSRGAYWLTAAALVGLAIGAGVPGSEPVGRFALPALFLQTLVVVGGLTEATEVTTPRWAARMLLVHHLVASVPLLALGLILGLDTWLGVGTFMLGAVPPAIAVPGYAAGLNLRVRPLIRFCIVSYSVGIVVTPVLVIAFFGSGGRALTIVWVLLFGLVLPGSLGWLCRSWLRRAPRQVNLGVVAICSLVLMVGMGAHLRDGILAGWGQPWLIVAASAVAVGRCLIAGALAWRFAPPDNGQPLRLEAALAGGGKNAVLAALLAVEAVGGASGLPALLGLIVEPGIVGCIALWLRRTFGGRTITSMVRQ